MRASLSSGSLLTLRIGRRSIAVLPLWPFVYFLGVLALLAVTLQIVDRRVLPRLERGGDVATGDWLSHRERLVAQRFAIVPPSDPDPVWRSLGFPVSPERTKSHRILVVGDSFAYGTGLANINDVWWRQLQRELERRGYHDVEVIAAGREGASTAHELELARTAVAKYHPDLLIWGYVTNDPDEGLISAVPPVPRPKTPRFDSFASALQTRWPRVASHLVELRHLKAAEQARRNGWFEYADWELKLLAPSNLTRYQETLRAVRRFQDEQKLPGFFFALPQRARREAFEERYRPVEPLFAKAGLVFVNDLPEFTRAYSNLPDLKFQALPTDSHPGPLVTHFHAVRAADFLERHYPAILGAKSAAPAAAPRFNDWLPAIIDADVSQQSQGLFFFDYPEQEWQLPFMPEGQPYVQLSLERPVALRRITAAGPGLESCSIEYTAIGPAGYDDGYAKTWSRGRCVLDVPVTALVNTIRIHATFGSVQGSPVITGRERIAVTPPFTAIRGVAWVATLPTRLSMVADQEGKEQSTLQLFEDGTRLGPAHSLHDQIAVVGHGRYSHWGPLLFFSSSDNSDPNTNGRRYEIDVEKITTHPRRIALTLTPAVHALPAGAQP